MNLKNIFNIISYFQYPLAILAIYFTILEDFNSFLIFMGLAISFSTLQDTNKIQNKFDKVILENPKKGKIFFVFVTVLAFFLIFLGICGYLITENEKAHELSIGTLVLGIGFISMLKTGLEMFEIHRKDKNTTANKVYKSLGNK